MTPGARRLAARGLLALTCVLLIAATVAAYATRVVFDSDRFANRAAAALQDPDVRAVIAERVTDEVVLQAQADLVAARPIIVSAVSGLVGSESFASLVRRGARDVHGAVFRRDEDTVTLTLVDVAIVLKAALQVLDPDLAAELAPDDRLTVFTEDFGAGADLVRAARDLRVLAWVLAALAAAAAAAAVGVSADRRRTASRLGFAIVAAGVGVVAAELIARWLVLGRLDEPEERAAAGAVWGAFFGDLRTVGWLLAAAGAVVTAAASSLLQPIAVEGSLRSVWRAVSTEPESKALRILRGATLAAAGVLVIVQPLAVLQIVALLGGVYVLYKGLEAILRLINPPVEPTPRRTGRRRLRQTTVAALAVLLIGAAAGTVMAGGAVDEPAPPVSRCNGHAELCDRPFDEVTLAATHNSMSVPLPGWFAALQDRPIADQLEDGIRALLFDSHYADRLGNGRTRTYFANPDELRRSIAEDGVSDEAVQSALRLRERAGFRGEGERGMYLCHTFCELGSTPLASVLNDVHGFLVTHPGEVLAIVNQDFVTPADFVGALDAAGLSDYAIEPPRSGPWPTLRELIERDHRLLVLAENEAGAAPWYQLVYERLTHETPFSFAAAAELTTPATLASTCRPNRGPAGAPLFLVNHWINTDPAPRPSNAVIVNAYDALLQRARTCERIRGDRVNLLAVDFYQRGDLFEVVDTLNGV